MRIIAYTLVIILYLLSNFFNGPMLQYLTGGAAILALIVSVKRASGLYFYSGLIFLIIGTGLFLTNDLPWLDFLLLFDSMLGILALFFVLPFLNSIIRVGHYDTNLNRLLQRGTDRLDVLFRRSFSISHTLGLFLNIATIPLLRSSLHRTLKPLPIETSNKFLTESLLRGYALCLMWSPLEVLVIASLDMTGFQYYQVILPIILLVILFFAINWGLSFFKYRQIKLKKTEHARMPAFSKTVRKLLEMLIMLCILVLLTSGLQHILNKGFLLAVVLTIIPISFGWALYIKKPKRYGTFTVPHWKERTNGLANYFFMFLSAGLFVEMLSNSGALSFLQVWFSALADRTLLLYFMIGAYFLFTSLVGFHPLVAITLLAQLLLPILPEVSSISLAIVLITSSLATVMYSPFNLSVSILANLLQINPYKIVKWNLPFALLYMTVSILVAFVIQQFF